IPRVTAAAGHNPGEAGQDLGDEAPRSRAAATGPSTSWALFPFWPCRGPRTVRHDPKLSPLYRASAVLLPFFLRLPRPRVGCWGWRMWVGGPGAASLRVGRRWVQW